MTAAQNGPRPPRQYGDLRERWLGVLSGLGDQCFGRGEYIGQEGFAPAREIETLARIAGVTADTFVLDLCCGAGGPARYVAWQTGCTVAGIDRSVDGVRLARRLAAADVLTDRVRFLVADAIHLPFSGGFDVVTLIETMLAFEHKAPLLAEVYRVLRPRGRFAFTLEAGAPLTAAERRQIPDGGSVWPEEPTNALDMLLHEGLRPVSVIDVSAAHAAIAVRLAAAFTRERIAIGAVVGDDTCRDLILAHERWAEWLSSGRIRKLAIVAERNDASDG